jgi:hypothetical protein
MKLKRSNRKSTRTTAGCSFMLDNVPAGTGTSTIGQAPSAASDGQSSRAG